MTRSRTQPDLAIGRASQSTPALRPMRSLAPNQSVAGRYWQQSQLSKRNQNFRPFKTGTRMNFALVQPQDLLRQEYAEPPLIRHGAVDRLGQDSLEFQMLSLERKQRR